MSASSARLIETVRIEASDPRSDNRRRVIVIARKAVLICRAVSGVAMTVRVPAEAYRGVALRITGLEDGRFRYEVKLAHRDPDLDVLLAEGHDQKVVEAAWREWVRFLRLPALVGRAHGFDVEVNTDATDMMRRLPCLRRRGRTLKGRRPRFLAWRKVGSAAPRNCGG